MTINEMKTEIFKTIGFKMPHLRDTLQAAAAQKVHLKRPRLCRRDQPQQPNKQKCSFNLTRQPFESLKLRAYATALGEKV